MKSKLYVLLCAVLIILFMSGNVKSEEASYSWSKMEATDTTFQTGDWLWWRPVKWKVGDYSLPVVAAEIICTDEDIENRNIEVAYAHADYCRECNDGNEFIRTSTPGKGMLADSTISSRVSSGTFNQLIVLRPVDESRIPVMNAKCDGAVGQYDWIGYYGYTYDTYIPTLAHLFKSNCLEKKVARKIYELFPFLTIGVGHCHSASCLWATAGLKNPPNCHTLNMFKLLREIRSGIETALYIAGEYNIVDGKLIPVE